MRRMDGFYSNSRSWHTWSDPLIPFPVTKQRQTRAIVTTSIGTRANRTMEKTYPSLQNCSYWASWKSLLLPRSQARMQVMHTSLWSPYDLSPCSHRLHSLLSSSKAYLYEQMGIKSRVCLDDCLTTRVSADLATNVYSVDKSWPF